MRKRLLVRFLLVVAVTLLDHLIPKNPDVTMAIWPAVIMAAAALTSSLMGSASQKAASNAQAKAEAEQAAFETKRKGIQTTASNQQNAFQQLMEGFRGALT